LGLDEKKKTVLLGFLLLVFLVSAYVENLAFFNYLQHVFRVPPLALLLVFVHNVLVVSLILLAMAFYVQLVLTFFPKRKYEYIVLEHPTIFALVYTILILVISIFRASTLVFGSVLVSSLGWIILLSIPNGLIEGYGIFLTIQKTLKRNLTLRDLLLIYLLFFIAATLEVWFTEALLQIYSAKVNPS
jgi:hypothetical protein